MTLTIKYVLCIGNEDAFDKNNKKVEEEKKVENNNLSDTFRINGNKNRL